MSDQQASEGVRPAYEPPRLVRHGKLAEVTSSTPELPDALDSTMWPGERDAGPEDA